MLVDPQARHSNRVYDRLLGDFRTEQSQKEYAAGAEYLRPFLDRCDSSASSENRQWIERRSCSFFDAQRCSRKQKLVTIKPPRLLDRSLEIEIIENVDPVWSKY